MSHAHTRVRDVNIFYRLRLKFVKLALPPLQISVVAHEERDNFAFVECMIRLCHLYDSTLPNHINGKVKKLS